MKRSFLDKKQQLIRLSEYLDNPKFIAEFTKAYCNDTKSNIDDFIDNEIYIPARILREIQTKKSLLNGRIPVGKVAVLMPLHCIGLTLAKVIATSYLMGNRTVIYFPPQLKETALVYSKMLMSFLGGITIENITQSGIQFINNSFINPDVKAIVIYGNYSWANIDQSSTKHTSTKVIFEKSIEENNNNYYAAVLGNNAPYCSKLKPIFSHEEVSNKFCKAFTEQLKKIRLSPPASKIQVVIL